MLNKRDGEKISSAVSYAKARDLEDIVQLLILAGASDASEANLIDFMGLCNNKIAAKKGWILAKDIALDLAGSSNPVFKLVGAGVKLTGKLCDEDKDSNSSSGFASALSDCGSSLFNCVSSLFSSPSKKSGEAKGKKGNVEDQASADGTFSRHQISESKILFTGRS